ncbi:hypothetical protein F0562_031788 [Nyssa sinensis]|uniref:RRM domain-containing protein n=1 Tax=Nyssa sinensis TaxID=561372 RepID=A0A5J5AZ67_9ASTE|nr:hypothetical protein F0562_031788 [Nyssa sinensis]
MPLLLWLNILSFPLVESFCILDIESGGDDGSKIFVGNLPFDVESEKLAHLFEQAGVVEIAEVIYNRETDRSRGFGFGTMNTVEDAEKAVLMFHRYTS